MAMMSLGDGKRSNRVKVICINYKDGKCLLPIEPTAICGEFCGKPPDTCVLLCDCDEEACNIGEGGIE